jgi:hypothetical protein
MLAKDAQGATCLTASSLERANGRAGFHMQRISVPNPKRAMNRRPETFAWYFLLSFTTFLRTAARYGGGIEDKDKECRVTESIKEGVSDGRGNWIE